MRCAGSVEVEETYSMLLLDEGRGSTVLEVLALPESFSRNTEGKCFRKRTIASSTRPDNIWDRISKKPVDFHAYEQRYKMYLDEAQLVSFGFQTVLWSY